MRRCRARQQRMLELWFWGATVAALLGRAAAAVINTEVKRKIDVSTNIAKITTTYAATGLPASGGSYKFALPLKSLPRLAFLKVTSERKEVPAVRVADEAAFAMFEVKAKAGTDGTFKLRVYTVYTDVLIPYPREITQGESQLVLYTEVLLAPTPYTTITQTTSVVLSGPEIENYDGHQPMTVSGATVTYGPYLEAKPLGSTDYLKVHYVNHAPFAKAEECLREIEVSMWGNIAVEELYELVHHGAKLKGGFSRLHYSMQRAAVVPNPSFRLLSAMLPPLAKDVYYRDRIGNISTSLMVPRSTALELQIMSRYPIFGGWKNSWYQGYNLPAEAALTHDGNNYTLQMAFGLPYSALWVDDYTVKVVLPEGATDVQASVPFAVEESRTRRFTYLDSPLLGGRPVVVLRKRNVVADHNVKFTVTFRFEQRFLFHEPLLLVGAFLAFFLLCITALRIDFRIRDGGGNRGASGGKDKQKEE